MTGLNLKGESTLTDEDGTELTLVFDVEAFIAAEELTDKSTDEIVNDLTRATLGGKVKLTTLRALLYAGLRRHHNLPPAEVSDLIGRVGHGPARDAVWKGLLGAYGDDSATEDGETANPPRKGRTGSRSSKPGAKPASRPTASGIKPPA